MSEVTSVNGKTGAVVLNATDVEAIPLPQKGTMSGVAALSSTGAVLSAVAGTENVALGTEAIKSGGAGQEQNTAVGAKALRVMGEGAGSNVAIGATAGYSLKKGEQNTLLGDAALRLGVNVSFATAVGYGALEEYSAEGESANVALGNGAGKGLDSGTYNTAIGSNCLAGNPGSKASGSNNALLGAAVLFEATTASNNTAVGTKALEHMTTGEENVAIGMYALWEAAAKESSANVCVGFGAGKKAGNANVMVGYRAGEGETGSNKLYIANSGTTEPLVLGDFETKELRLNTTKLGLNGKVPVEPPAEIKVGAPELTKTSPYGFKTEAQLKSLVEAVEKLAAMAHNVGLTK